jgi:DNA-directed RNA polymerase subunit RPC12/RpoP
MQLIIPTVSQEVNQNDYVCPRCKKQFNQLDVASLVALTASAGRFDLCCDVCGTEIVQKSKMSGAQQGEQEKDAVNARMQSFNEQTHGIRQTLQLVEKIRYEK